MKYLVFKYADTTLERVYLFPEEEQHSDFATRAVPEGWSAIRGGFVRVPYGTKVQVYGEAFSLGLCIDKGRDVALLTKALGFEA